MAFKAYSRANRKGKHNRFGGRNFSQRSDSDNRQQFQRNSQYGNDNGYRGRGNYNGNYDDDRGGYSRGYNNRNRGRGRGQGGRYNNNNNFRAVRTIEASENSTAPQPQIQLGAYHQQNFQN